VDEVALIQDTINHYAPVLIAPLSIQIRRAGVQKKFFASLGRAPAHHFVPSSLTSIRPAPVNVFALMANTSDC
jgi:hypothetical protein